MVTRMTTEDCLFCRIIAGELPAERVAETERSIAFRDINPAAPVHVLVVPRRHEPNIGALTGAAPEDLVDVFSLVTEVAEREGVSANHRVIANTGAGAGQTIFHAHVHVLGGRDLPER
jgi:histidine triad (HIT) family protein